MTVCLNAFCIVLNKQNRNNYGEALVHSSGLSKHGTFLMWKITKMRNICPFSFSQKFCITPFINSLLQNVTVGFLVYSQPDVFDAVMCLVATVLDLSFLLPKSKNRGIRFLSRHDML